MFRRVQLQSGSEILKPSVFQRFCSNGASFHTNSEFSTFEKQLSTNSIHRTRQEIAPWIEIGKYQKDLLAHLSTSEILRALTVLKLCSYRTIVDQSAQLLEKAVRMGTLGKFVLRTTFFNQFVGGDTERRMTEVVTAMRQRNLSLMVLPVLEEDVEDLSSPTKTYEDNLQTLQNTIKLTSTLGEGRPLVQLKMTAIMPAETLEKISRMLNTDSSSLNAKLVSKIANCIDNGEELSAWRKTLGDSDTNKFLAGLKRANTVVNLSKKLGVRVLVDAEFYACRTAITLMAMALMVRHNYDGPVVGSTIQAYMKDAVSALKAEMKIIQQDMGTAWYGKVVRGAYMDRERFLAKKYGYASPICDTYEQTNTSYNFCLKEILHHLANNPSRTKSSLLVATHNETSIRHVAQLMKDLQIDHKNGPVSFAQIYGMADYLSAPLVHMEYKVYKSTPYGPMEKVLAYMARRASENRSVVEGAREERAMLLKELGARFVV